MSDSADDDYLLGSVPASKRRGLLTMGLLWITMVTCFPNVLAGFQWFRDGMTLPQALWGVFVSCVIIMVYSIPACYLGAKCGLTYTVLSRSVFGKWGARLISANVIWISSGWYAMNAIFLAEAIRGLFHLSIPQAWFAAIIAILMAFNNFFGFSGVANFAQYLAAPVLLLWVGIAFFKSAGACPSTVWTEIPHVSNSHSLSIVSSFVIGIACWGNEPDYWRFGKAKWSFPVIPLLVALLIGQVIFPVTGWMMARLSGVTDFAAATSLMNNYVFGGLAIISVTVLGINYIAVNDSGLYAAINAAENLKNFPRKYYVVFLAMMAAGAAAVLDGYKNNFVTVAALSCIVLPCSTVIMATEAFLIKRFWGKAEDLSVLIDYEKLPPLRWAAVVSLIIGCVIAGLNSGILPGTEKWAWGIPSLQGWLISLVLYVFLRALELKYSSRPLCTLSDEEQTSGDFELAAKH